MIEKEGTGRGRLGPDFLFGQLLITQHLIIILRRLESKLKFFQVDQ